jgi:hypothetical protein
MRDEPLFPLLAAFDDRRVGAVYMLLLLFTLGVWFQASGSPAPLVVIVALPAGVAVHRLEARYGGMSLLGIVIVALLLLVVGSDLLVVGSEAAWLSGVVGFLLGYLLSVLQSARRAGDTDETLVQ